MFNQMKKRIKNEKGLTLVELLAVIVILAIISAIAVPSIGNIVDNSRDKAILSEALNVISGAKIAHMDGKCGTTTVSCNGAALQPYVDGVTTTGTNIVVALNNKKEWTITGMANLGAFFSAATADFAVTDGSTEAVIKDVLENGKKVVTPPGGTNPN